MNITTKRTQHILSILEARGAEIVRQYGEPGYSAANGVILFDWNDCGTRVVKYLELAGYDCEWSDEWIICNEGKAWRTQPSHAFWQPSYIYSNDGDIITRDEDAVFWIEAVVNNPKACLPTFIDVASGGYVKFEEEQETGLRIGQDASPEDTYKRAKNAGYDYVIFKIVDTSMFELRWQCYVMKEEE